jgi:hypothetical protein
VIFAGLKEEFSMLTAGVGLFVASVEFPVFDEQEVNTTAKNSIRIALNTFFFTIVPSPFF